MGWNVTSGIYQGFGLHMHPIQEAAGPEPSYELCTGVTGHAETVNVIYNPEEISLETILKNFWECHDPTQGMRQGNDIGEQYRSAIYCSNPEFKITEKTRKTL